MLSVAPEEGAWRGHSSYLGCVLPLTVHCKQKLNAVFALHFFFSYKKKSSLDFSANQKTGTKFHKSEVVQSKFLKAGTTCTPTDFFTTLLGL